VLDALVEEAIAQASRHHKIGAPFDPQTLVRDFIAPVLDLQERYPAPLVEKALTITIRQRRLPGEFRGGSFNRGWWKYAAAICENKSAAGSTRLAQRPSRPTIARPSQPTPSRPDVTSSTPPVAQPVSVKVINITLDSAHDNAAWLSELRLICAAHPGTIPVRLIPPGGSALPLTSWPGSLQITVSLTAAFVAAVKTLREHQHPGDNTAHAC
jgi:hypothetical protein